MDDLAPDRPARDLTLHEVVGRREVERRTIFRGRAGRLPWGGVAVSARGDLAWEASVVEFQRAGAKVVTRAARDGEGLAFEDRGATLRWLAGAGGDVVYTDLRRPRQRDGCPRRERFATLAENEQVLVTRAAYGGVEQHTVIRLCSRGEGADHVVAQAVAPDGTAATLDAGPAGTIANLRSAGNGVTWTHAGEPRSAQPA